ncbi:MAG: amino acid permease [Planctomycetota bacterium]
MSTSDPTPADPGLDVAGPSPGAAPAEGRHRFGTFGGVFTPSILTILGVIMFMRTNYVLGYAGVWQTVLILVLAQAITFFTSLSICAIATNMQVRGGGSYYMISRVLGPEFGGAIGIAYFFALALSVPFYVLGFTEAFCRSLEPFPGLEQIGDHFQVIAFVTAAGLFAIAYLSARFAIKTQFFIMIFLGLAIVAFLGGAIATFSVDRFWAHWSPASAGELADHGLPVLGFWVVFAIFFPAVTGVDAGVNMSGDLKDPSRSIPRGVLAALGVGFAVYLSQILLGAGAYPRYGDPGLITKPFHLLRDNALFGPNVGGLCVVLGVFAATLSSALGSFLGAPRVLQAVARDPVLTVLRPFAKGTVGGDEPRRALLFVAALTAGVLLWAGNESEGGALNVVAAIVTMFFLYSYGIMNMAAFVEGLGANPSFRPRFRWFHWGTALVGMLGCTAASFLINPPAAGGAVLLIAILFWAMRRRQLAATFGDARRGFLYSRVRDYLLRLRDMPEDARNWRPNFLVFSGNPASRETLVSYAVWLEAGRGIVLLAQVLVGAAEALHRHRLAAARQLQQFCRKRGLHAFPAVVVAPTVDAGVGILLQTAGLGPVRPNFAAFGWPEESTRAVPYVRHLRMAAAMEMGLLLVRERGAPAIRFGGRQRIDLWWRGQKNGAAMVLLAWLLRCNWEWANAELRVLRLVPEEAGRAPAREALETLLATGRVEGTPVIIVTEEPFADALQRTSRDAACVVLGFDPPEEEDAAAWHEGLERTLDGLPTTLLVSSHLDGDVLA